MSRLAVEQGRASEALVVEAIERLVNYGDWFVREVQPGLGQPIAANLQGIRKSAN